MSTPRKVRINRLVLDGIEAHDRRAVVAAFEAELARLLREHPDSVPDARRVLPATSSAADVGRRAAAAVHAEVVGRC